MELGKTVTLDFIISDPSTGEPVNADAPPSAAVYEDTDVAAMYNPVPALRGPAVGHYLVVMELTTDNGFEKGKSYNLVITATVGGAVAKTVLATFIIDDTMDKKTNVAALLNNISPPSTFVPIVEGIEMVEPLPIDDVYGHNSSHENKDLFVQYWNTETKAWKTGVETAMDAEYMAEVNAYQQNINAYQEELAAWQANYEMQREIQYRAMYAEALIAATE